jgi:hypothetical protein
MRWKTMASGIASRLRCSGFQAGGAKWERAGHLAGHHRPRAAVFRPIAGLRNPLLEPVLQRLGVFLASWTRRGYDTRVRDPELVYARLTRQLAAGDILLLHDGNAARMADGTPVILQVLPRLLENCPAASCRR